MTSLAAPRGTPAAAEPDLPVAMDPAGPEPGTGPDQLSGRERRGEGGGDVAPPPGRRAADPSILAGVEGMWALRASPSRAGRRYELRIADDVGCAGLAAVLTMLPDGLAFDRADLISDGTLGTGRPELVLEFTRPLVP